MYQHMQENTVSCVQELHVTASLFHRKGLTCNICKPNLTLLLACGAACFDVGVNGCVWGFEET